jgi:hypothetical protein
MIFQNNNTFKSKISFFSSETNYKFSICFSSRKKKTFNKKKLALKKTKCRRLTPLSSVRTACLDLPKFFLLLANKNLLVMFRQLPLPRLIINKSVQVTTQEQTPLPPLRILFAQEVPPQASTKPQVPSTTITMLLLQVVNLCWFKLLISINNNVTTLLTKISNLLRLNLSRT